ncbi:hypothetical protein F5Y18DRAFT_431063 [Xylariaceae sp. FL1019]|nr:hypothetical protein F5Y18DRAFT_431063 [Xylariaceae sp. FL1019]
MLSQAPVSPLHQIPTLVDDSFHPTRPCSRCFVTARSAFRAVGADHDIAHERLTAAGVYSSRERGELLTYSPCSPRKRNFIASFLSTSENICSSLILNVTDESEHRDGNSYENPTHASTVRKLLDIVVDIFKAELCSKLPGKEHHRGVDSSSSTPWATIPTDDEIETSGGTALNKGKDMVDMDAFYIVNPSHHHLYVIRDPVRLAQLTIEQRIFFESLRVTLQAVRRYFVKGGSNERGRFLRSYQGAITLDQALLKTYQKHILTNSPIAATRHRS